ncbi:MFS transporter [Microlunatus sagamiharensis]|nr:MFS transporter [Microlunatus sagamiharensis]
MEILDGTVLATAAPAIAADFGVAPVDVNLAVTAYLVALAAGIPVSGWLAARWGSRRVLLLGIVLFTVASALCAASTSLPVMVLDRVLQGGGGALMVPVGRLVVLRSTPKEDLLPTIAYLTWPALLAPVVAPSLGGWVVTVASWHWIFLVNVPLGVVACVAAVRLVPRTTEPLPARLDRRGLALTTAVLVSVLVGLELLRPGSSPLLGVLLLGVGGLLGVAAVRWLRRAPDPLLDLDGLGVRSFRAANVEGSVYRAVISAVPFVVPLLLQVGLGWSAARAGLLLMALFVGNVGVKPLTTPLLRCFGFRAVLVWSIAGGALVLLGLALVGPSTPVPVLAGALVLSGALRSVGFSAYNSLQFADVDPERLRGANVLSATVQQVAGALGVAGGALLLRVGQALGSGSGFDADGLLAYRTAFVVLAVVLLVPLVDAVRLPAAVGEEVTGRRA